MGRPLGGLLLSRHRIISNMILDPLPYLTYMWARSSTADRAWLIGVFVSFTLLMIVAMKQRG
jgi:hypothetical protein